MQRGENVFAEMAGVRFYEHSEALKGTFWLSQILMLNVILRAAKPVGSGILTVLWMNSWRRAVVGMA